MPLQIESAPSPRPAGHGRWCFAPAQAAFQGNPLTTSFASCTDCRTRMRLLPSVIRRERCMWWRRPLAIWPISACARLHVLQMVDCIACEDTRHTQGMLRSYGLERPGHQLLAVHQHNEAEAAASRSLTACSKASALPYVSDAGTPGVSDPGARLCAALASSRPAQPFRCPVPAASPRAISVAGHMPPRAHRWRLSVCRFLAHQECRAPKLPYTSWPSSRAAPCCWRHPTASIELATGTWPCWVSARSRWRAKSPNNLSDITTHARQWTWRPGCKPKPHRSQG